MRALLYLLTLISSCFLKNGFCGGIKFKDFKKNPEAMSLVAQYYDEQNNKIRTQAKLLINLKGIGLAISETTLTRYLMDIEEEAQQNPAGFGSQSTEWLNFSNPAPPFIQAPQIAQQSSNFTSGNPGSSTSASNRGKSTNSGGGSRKITFKRFKNDPRAMDLVERFNNKQITDTALSEALEQINHKMSTKAMYLYLNRLNEEKKAGSGAPNLQDTQIAQQSNFTSDNPGTNWFEENSQNDDGDLESMIRKPSSSGGFYGTPYFPNQSQSTGLTDASNFFSPTPNTSNFTSGNPGSASHYGGAMPFQQAPMSGTSFSSFPNYPCNQSAPSTNIGPSQTETDSWEWSGGNSHNDEGTLYSVVRPKRPSSSKDKSAVKTGKKTRK